jgi:hypothetical protein
MIKHEISPISREAFLDPSDSYFLFADFVDFYAHWTYILYMPIFSRIFLSNSYWEKCDEKYLGRTEEGKDGRTEGRTKGQKDGRMDGRTDGQR